MPLSLRRSKDQPQASNPKRTVLTPTLLSRFRSSAFSSSKVSLLATSPYESVRARTPPIPVSRPPGPARPPLRRPKSYGALHARWRSSARRLNTPEQRDCLMGAECIEVRDPLLGRLASPDVSLDLESGMSSLSISAIQEESSNTGMEGIEQTKSSSPMSVDRPYSTLPHTPPPRPRLHNLFRPPALRKRVPISSAYVSLRPRPAPHHATTVLELDRTPERMVIDPKQDSSSFSSPVMVLLTPPLMSPRPRSPTPHRMSSRPVSPITP